MPNLHDQGLLADEKLRAQGLVVTQGGEPTFTPHDSTAPEWNTAALGREKLVFARRLSARLADTLLPGSVVIQSSGKQYPGEPIPRWSMGLYRRTDSPLWRDPRRLRLDDAPLPPIDLALGKTLLEGIASSLSCAATLIPAYEDVESWMRFEQGRGGKVPLPRFSKSKRNFIIPADWTDAEAAHWTEHCGIRGWVLPLFHDEVRWQSPAWTLPPGDDLTLLVGNSSIGLRLPLDQVKCEGLKYAMTIEVREGELCLFIPPIASLAAFTELAAIIEKLCVELNLPPLVLEGYPPPKDPALESFSMMADPGVLEVNLPPAASWPGFASVIDKMYEAAGHVGLRGYKFQFSGRKVSTGGGAHIVLGGPTALESPFHLRPALLSSLLRFIQNHPSLSYVFTGLFIGPSSQAPRIDESCFETPYELEITLQHLEKMTSPGDPATIDAMLRNLLLDWNGNTHRAELSVDKFWNPHAPNGQLGLIELRAFEMMPDAPMFLAINALIRALIACFAEQPYSSPLIAWREALHDRFALPYFLEQDLQKVLEYLKQRGFSFQIEWFKPHFDFRFPIVIRFEEANRVWELRQALEPWPVMGEQPVAGGTARSVDASTDRLQLRAWGVDPQRLGAAVNGVRLPLQLQSDGTLICGLRYRLINARHGLQPQVTAHSPLQFAFFERPSDTIIYAFEYLNWKPESSEYSGLPKEDNEARARVLERLRVVPGIVGQKTVSRETELSPDAPLTLDLRRF